MINENATLNNRHTLILGQNGSGKSQLLRQLKDVPKNGHVVVFDPNGDHKDAKQVTTRAALAGELARLRRLGKPFKLAYRPEGVNSKKVNVANHEFFCQCVCLALDGKRPRLFVLDEELAQSCRSPMNADPFHHRLITQGRKFGAVYIGVAQRPQDIPKVIFDEVAVLCVGGVAIRAADYIAREVGIPVESINALKPLEFFIKDKAIDGGKPFKKVLKYKK